MDILVLISGFLQNFLGIGQLEEGEVLRGLLEGRVGVWEGFDCGEKGIDITVTRSASAFAPPVQAYLITSTCICNDYEVLYRVLC